MGKEIQSETPASGQYYLPGEGPHEAGLSTALEEEWEF